MSSEIRLPTLLALLILLTGIIVGVYSVSQNQVLSTKADESAIPEKIEVDNISDTSVSIAWQTPKAVSSFVSFGVTPKLGETSQDDRDTPNLSPHALHLVTLNDLAPNTIYYFNITSGHTTYPDQPMTFKTTPLSATSSDQPLIGVVIDNNMQPIEEALVKLEISGAYPLITITKGNGSFILPLSQIKNKDLSSSFQIKPNTLATLTVSNLNEKSKITLKLPPENKLPAITLGKDQDLTIPTPSPTLPPVLGASKIIFNLANFDFNNDKKVDDIDLSLLITNIDKKPINLKYDLSGDNKIDEQDLELFKQGLKQANF